MFWKRPRSAEGALTQVPIVQRPRTPAFHAGNAGSNPAGDESFPRVDRSRSRSEHLPRMSDYQPFIDDPNHLTLVNGERYVVLRPTGIVARAYAEVQAAVRRKLFGSLVSFPAQGHVTMKGFPRGTALIDVQKVVRQWAASVPPQIGRASCRERV